MGLNLIINETKPKMKAVVEDLMKKLAAVRTGRASTSILDNVYVDYYGTSTPLNQMASVSVPEPQMLVVQAWDATQIDAIEKAIAAANLGINPSNDGKVIRLPIPPLNEERRQQLAKQVNEIAEEHRIAARNVRQHSNNELKKLLQNKEISEDNERIGLEEVQKLTNETIADIDDHAKKKEAEILTV
ncbi:MAG: ribosome recycling factor [Acidobacteriota bacterium]|nr:ribosome recycling factor [Acidobacteriota bacterium]MDH3529855.1 ribosome recycling factor [Acidobacteriota bacterium]